MIKETDITHKILRSVKREFSRSDLAHSKLKTARIETPRYKQNGEPFKSPNVHYKCEICKALFKQDEVEVDHIDPVVPLSIPTKHMCWNVLIEERCFVDDLSKLQILCKKGCHKKKSTEENRERRLWKKKEKHIVYMTTNTVNGKKYIGVHKCVNLDDGYIGSGYALKSAITKYGKDKFYRKVLYCFDNAKAAYDKEKELVNEDIVNSVDFYNLVGGGKFSGVMCKDSKAKATAKKTGKRKKSKHTIKIKASNLRTGEVREFDSILECAQTLGISYAAVLKVCKRRYNQSMVYDWTFETDKYGKALPARFKK